MAIMLIFTLLIIQCTAQEKQVIVLANDIDCEKMYFLTHNGFTYLQEQPEKKLK
ncbi:MAG: hypothetical protein PVF58_01850 [Candidatus Methanofastidiosia archaeon]|jgi:hypothetical protein